MIRIGAIPESRWKVRPRPHASWASRVNGKKGTWQLINKPTPNILLGHTGYPIEVKGKVVRLLIDGDLGWSYEKTQ
jgi:hypothetical protein